MIDFMASKINFIKVTKFRLKKRDSQSNKGMAVEQQRDKFRIK